ncbi:MAG TPA: imidazolonepropionase [Bacillota bacterium]|jgi:imidazolonepropionase|nr:imidazolonepropionase [Fastidiosipila sp.]HPX93586.1 imidazolonepropionase [Bacillota bacterium]HQB80561.1 imidazolonepropionase [Bacillota bacterium]
MAYFMMEHAAELATPCGTKAREGSEMKDLLLIPDGAVIWRDDIIVFVGTTHEAHDWIERKLQSGNQLDRLDASGRTVIPGFVDPHTHFVFGGYRDQEFNRRLQGASYMEIMEAGGGIASTNKATKEASEDQLYQSGWQRLDRMLELGITTVEGKTGYGEDTETEDKMLRVLERLDRDHPVDIVKTYMGAHALPRRFKGNTAAYIDYLIEEGLPMARGRADFCDVFTEKGVFELEDSERLLEAARAMGFKLKMHADEIVHLGGAGLAAKLGATSADHLLKASDRDLLAMRDAGVIATLLPLTAFSLKESYARGRFMIDQGLAVALGTDLNPGSCYSQSIPLMIALAAIYMDFTVEEALTAVTLNAAASIGLAESRGSLEEGKQADILILDCPNHGHLSYHFAMNLVEIVVKDGRLVRPK